MTSGREEWGWGQRRRFSQSAKITVPRWRNHSGNAIFHHLVRLCFLEPVLEKLLSYISPHFLEYKSVVNKIQIPSGMLRLCNCCLFFFLEMVYFKDVYSMLMSCRISRNTLWNSEASTFSSGICGNVEEIWEKYGAIDIRNVMSQIIFFWKSEVWKDH